MEDLKATILQLESKLQRKEDELQARTTSFQEALSREQERAAEREAKELARRNELTAKVTALTEERAQLKSQIATLSEIEEDAARKDQEVKIARRELVEFRVKAQDDRKSLEEQLADRRRTQEKHRQEVSDLRCHISVLEHRLQHSQAKLTAQDAHTDSLAKTQEELRTALEEKAALERTLKTESARFSKDRRTLEDRAEAALAELKELKSGPSRVELCAKYEAQLDELRWIAMDAVHLVSRGGGPTPPTDPTDNATMRAYVDAAVANHSNRMHSFRSGGTGSWRKAPPSPKNQAAPPPIAAVEVFSDAASQDDDSVAEGLCEEAASTVKALKTSIASLSEDKQLVLLRRFADTVRAHVTDGPSVAPSARGFGVASGMPSVRDEPATLVNHIALVTVERDALKSQLESTEAELEHVKSQLVAAKTSTKSPSKQSTPAAQPKDEAVSPSPRRATGTAPGATSAPPPLLGKRGSVGGGASQQPISNSRA